MIITKHKVHKFHEHLFDIVINIAFVLLFVSLFGISQSAPKYLDFLDYYLRIYICLFLIWRFNPLREKIHFTSLDAKISFNAGLFILASTTFNTYIKIISTGTVDKIKQFI
jgi:hypothetical protein